MLDGQTQLTAMFGAPERLSKDPRPAPAPVVTPPGSRSKRKWAPANAIPPLLLPPLAKTPKKAVPPGWMRYGLAPALRRCDECGDDVVGAFRRPDGDFSFRTPPDHVSLAYVALPTGTPSPRGATTPDSDASMAYRREPRRHLPRQARLSGARLRRVLRPEPPRPAPRHRAAPRRNHLVASTPRRWRTSGT